MRASTFAGVAVSPRTSFSSVARTRARQFVLGFSLVLGLSLTAAPASGPAQASPITDAVKKVTKKADRLTKPSVKRVKATTRKATKPGQRRTTGPRNATRSTPSPVRQATAPLAPARRLVDQRVRNQPAQNGSVLKRTVEPAEKAVRKVRATTRNRPKPVPLSTPPVIDLVIDLTRDKLDPVLDALPNLTEPLLPSTPPPLSDPGIPAGHAVRGGAGRFTDHPPVRPGTEHRRLSSRLATTVAFLLTGRPSTDPQSISTYSGATYLVLTPGAVTGLGLGATSTAGPVIDVAAGAALCGAGVRPGRAWRMPRVTRAGPTHAWTTPPEPGFSPD